MARNTKWIITEGTLIDTASAIRQKAGISGFIHPEDFATEISNIPTGGGGSGEFDWRVDGNAGTPEGGVLSNSKITNLRPYAFAGLGSLIKTVNLPAIDVIEKFAFIGCSLTAATIFPQGASSGTIGTEAFSGCSSMAIPTGIENAKTIWSKAFYGCSGMAGTLTLGSKWIDLDSYCFQNCTKLTGLVFDGPARMDGEQWNRSGSRSCFDGCSQLATIYAKSDFSAKFISPSSNTMFKNCPLTDVKIMGKPDIHDNIFSGITTIKRVIFGTTETAGFNLSSLAFKSCSGVTDVYVGWPEGAVSGAPWGMTNATIHYDTTFDSDGEPITT